MPEERVSKRATLRILRRERCLLLTGLTELNGKLYIGSHANYVWALALGPLPHRFLSQVPRESPNMEISTYE